MRPTHRLAHLIAFVGLSGLTLIAEAQNVVALTKGLQQHDGLITLFASPQSDRVLALFPSPDTEGQIGTYIYASRLRSGLGSNPVGLDRGAGDFGQLIGVARRGNSIVMTALNTDYRASSDSLDERVAVDESFARSVLWRSEILATADDGELLVDLSTFLIRDQLGIAAQLARRGQGTFGLDSKRSYVASEQWAFPDNVEMEAVLTFSSAGEGDEVQQTAPDARSVSVTLHHSLVRLPDEGYVTREADPRTAAIDIQYYDFAQPLAASLTQRLARRFRLQKTTPGTAPSPVVKPIVFYIDRGAPEPLRSALLEGAQWWAEAFEAAGFEGGYEARLLPEGAHPLDIRYNVVQWVHRQTRGWSYGGGVADPRTGEMLKGHVILGSQRVRQDRMIFEGLAGRAGTGSGSADDPLQISLARIRQLSAHEIGHALGFNHNMAASTNQRASVMDYPAPLVTRADNGLDFSQAYGVGVGAWDRFTVAWLYSEFDSQTDTPAALRQMVAAAYDSGLRFVADQHSRPLSAAHPFGSLWDNGEDPIASLNNVLAVREFALRNFGLDRIADQQSVSDLQTVFAPIYLYHRYQTLAATKLIGGFEFDYALAGSETEGVLAVDDARQRLALSTVLTTLTPGVLAIPQRIQALMMPPLDAWEPVSGRERIKTQVAPIFDPQHAAAAGAALTLQGLLNPQRLGRLALARSGDSRRLSVTQLLRQTVAVVFDGNVSPGADALIQQAVQQQLIHHLIGLDGNAAATLEVRAAARASLMDISAQLRSRSRAAQSVSVRGWLARQIDQYLESGQLPDALRSAAATIPPGSPIGADSCWHCDSAIVLQQYQ
ncbi:MAG: zinc-dependent metalloprotease [Pseudomonadota bacterium]